MSRRETWAACVVLGAGLCLAPASLSAKGNKAEGDQKFVNKATVANLAEINHGNLALQQASDPEVRQYAQRLVADHTMANHALIAVTNKKNMRVPQDMSKKHREMQEHLTKLKGAEFDREFIAHMVDGHKEAVSLFENEAKDGHDADLKAFASKTLPTLKEHLKMAERLAERIKKPSKKS